MKEEEKMKLLPFFDDYKKMPLKEQYDFIDLLIKKYDFGKKIRYRYEEEKHSLFIEPLSKLPLKNQELFFTEMTKPKEKKPTETIRPSKKISASMAERIAQYSPAHLKLINSLEKKGGEPFIQEFQEIILGNYKKDLRPTFFFDYIKEHLSGKRTALFADGTFFKEYYDSMKPPIKLQFLKELRDNEEIEKHFDASLTLLKNKQTNFLEIKQKIENPTSRKTPKASPTTPAVNHLTLSPEKLGSTVPNSLPKPGPETFKDEIVKQSQNSKHVRASTINHKRTNNNKVLNTLPFSNKQLTASELVETRKNIYPVELYFLKNINKQSNDFKNSKKHQKELNKLEAKKKKYEKEKLQKRNIENPDKQKLFNNILEDVKKRINIHQKALNKNGQQKTPTQSEPTTSKVSAVKEVSSFTDLTSLTSVAYKKTTPQLSFTNTIPVKRSIRSSVRR